MNSDIKSEIKRLSNLKQNADKPDIVIEKQAQKNVVLKELLDSGNFTSDGEKKQAKQCFEKYLETNDFESFSDLSTLAMLVYNEILVGRIQKTINECTTKDGKSYISDKLVKSLHEAENQVLALKEKLKIDKTEEHDDFSALQLLKKRFHNWIQENRNEFTLSVPYTCSACKKEDVKLILLRKRVKDFEVLEHPHFSGRFWYNKVAMDMVESGKLLKEDYAKIFATSVEYVEWALNNKGKIILDTGNIN